MEACPSDCKHLWWQELEIANRWKGPNLYVPFCRLKSEPLEHPYSYGVYEDKLVPICEIEGKPGIFTSP